MAAADLHKRGKLIEPDPEPTMPKGQSTPQVRSNQHTMKRKLRVVK